jgi:hypothetical protein
MEIWKQKSRAVLDPAFADEEDLEIDIILSNSEVGIK